MSTLDPTIETLVQLSQADDPDPRAIVGVVADLGRVLVDPAEYSLSELEAALAAARSRFGGADSVDASPLSALSSEKGSDFVVGAFWACEDIVSAYNRQLHAQQERRSQRLRRETVRAIAMKLLEAQVLVSPADISSAYRSDLGEAISKDTVSKALTDLINDGQIEAAPSPVGGDRRQKFYRVLGDEHECVKRNKVHVSLDNLNRSFGFENPNDFVQYVEDWLEDNTSARQG